MCIVLQSAALTLTGFFCLTELTDWGGGDGWAVGVFCCFFAAGFVFTEAVE